MNTKKRAIVLTIQLFVAALHIFPTGELFGLGWYVWYYSYFSDIALPFAFYFLLFFVEKEISALKNWWLKALIVFLAATCAEILQYFHIYALGISFDPLDIVMYAIGVGLAALTDQLLFPRIFRFWREA